MRQSLQRYTFARCEFRSGMPQTQQRPDCYELRAASLQVFHRAANRRSSIDDVVDHCDALAAKAGAQWRGNAVSNRIQIVGARSDELLREIKLRADFLGDHLREKSTLDQRAAHRFDTIRLKHPCEARDVRPQAIWVDISLWDFEP